MSVSFDLDRFVEAQEKADPVRVFGSIDAVELRSSPTLFEAAGSGTRFARALYGGERDLATLGGVMGGVQLAASASLIFCRKRSVSACVDSGPRLRVARPPPGAAVLNGSGSSSRSFRPKMGCSPGWRPRP